MMIDRRLRALLACVALAAPCLPVWPQLVEQDVDWKEVDVPPPPAFSAEQLLSVEMPPHLSLKFGVDPATIAISSDGVVRYVVVARSPSGALNAMYEGIRCATGEFRTYARFSTSGKWMPASSAAWRAMDESTVSRHTRAFAFQGVCEGRSRTGQTPQDIARKMRGQSQEKIN